MPNARWTARLALMATMILSWPAQGEDLLEVWRMALQRDPLYAASGSLRDAQQEAVPQARAQLLPFVTADAAVELDDSRRLRTLGDSHRDDRALWALTLTQPIVDVRAWSGLERAQYVARQADVDRAGAYQDLVLRVAQAYFDVLAAQDTLRALEAEKRAVQAQLQAAQQGFELGSTTIADTHEAQARLDLIEASEWQARNAVQVSREALARITYQPPGPLHELAPGLQLPAPQPTRLEDWTAQSSNANLAVARAELSARIAEAQIDIAKGERYPRLALQAQTGSATDRGLNYPNGGPRSLDSRVGIQLSIPLYTGGEISSVIREQASRLQQARFELENARRVAVQDTHRYFSGVTSGLARIEALEAAEASSLAALEANRTGYEIGVRVNIDVLNAQQQLYETQRNLALTRYDTLMDSLRLKAASGILGEDDILAVNALLVPPSDPGAPTPGPVQPSITPAVPVSPASSKVPQAGMQ